ncbi:Spc97/Spc98 family protein [Xylariaceae sp. FL0016]|nr:Spc97/Spc98 family protein [Xylariaceae sp. FL0016]
MLHEILLSLSGHPSPLLRNDHSDAAATSILSPPERDLLTTAGHLSDLHCKLLSYTSQISVSHSSVICRAVSTAISSLHLRAFQAKILEVEETILRKDVALVGAYNIVPLTAVIGEFSGWTRRLEWLWGLAQFMSDEGEPSACRAAQLINRLRDELQTGYSDIGETALSLVKVAETAWLKQVSAWVLYGRIPTLGDNDFFIQRNDEGEQVYSIDHNLLPSFVTSSTAASMLFIGTSLNRVQARSGADFSRGGINHLSSQLHELAQLTFPLNGASFSRAVNSIRLILSRTTLQKLLPLAKVLEMLHVLREFFLLGRGEFAMALTQQADEKIRSRWRRAENLAYQKKDDLGTVVVKDGEVATVLAKTWAVLSSMQGHHSDEDEQLELARDIVQLKLFKTKSALSSGKPNALASTPFRNLLFSVPVLLTVQIPSPLDLFLSTSDMQIYTSINSYLLSVRRSHLRLTDLWKITSLRRHHPPPPRAPFGNTKSGIARTKLLRERWSLRSSTMRSAWSTSSAAIFFLAETEAYLQIEIVEGLWSHFHSWLTGNDDPLRQYMSRPVSSHSDASSLSLDPDRMEVDECIRQKRRKTPDHDPQTLATAHRLFLRALTRRLLLTQPSFTDPLYELLVHIDVLVALVHRLDNVWTNKDLEADEGVVHAFSNLDAEENEVRASLQNIEAKVKGGIEDVIEVLRGLSMNTAFLAGLENILGEGTGDAEELGLPEEGTYIPKRVGGIDRLLMKLDFGGWFGKGRSQNPGQIF